MVAIQTLRPRNGFQCHAASAYSPASPFAMIATWAVGVYATRP